LLFSQVNSGAIRVLIGSTSKLGTGVNVQKKLIAIHHLDVPWRPADMVQREGRMLRQGNENKEVGIYRYITEGSFDAYSWQLLETKQRFITDILSGFAVERDADEIDGSVLDYAEVKALAIGNAKIKERVETLNELNKFKLLQSRAVQNKKMMIQELRQLPNLITKQQDIIEKAKEDFKYIESIQLPEEHKRSKEEESDRQIFRNKLYLALEHNTLEPKERLFDTYRGFEIVLPAGMKYDKKYVYLVKNGKYKIDLGDTEIGNLIRLDNFLSVDAFAKKLEAYNVGLSKNREKQTSIKKALARDESFEEQINVLSEKLKELDEELGVKYE